MVVDELGIVVTAKRNGQRHADIADGVTGNSQFSLITLLHRTGL